MSKYRHNLGRWGEDTAAEYLIAMGYSIVDRNVRTPYGEIDIIASLNDALIFVEVKTRATSSYGFPEVSVTPKKQQHIIETIEYYLQEHADTDCVWRIDVIAIRSDKFSKKPEIKHFQNAITGG